MVLDGDDRVSLIHPGEAWVGLPWNDILTSIDSGEFDSVVAERDSQPSATPWRLRMSRDAMVQATTNPI